MIQVGVKVEVLPQRQLRIERERLRHESHPPPGFDVAGIHHAAKEPGLPLGGRQQSGQHFHGGRLAATIRAKKAKNLAALNAEAHLIHGGEIPEFLGESLRFDHRVVAGTGHPRWQRERVMSAPFFFGQQRDERRFKAARSRLRLDFSRRAGGEDLPGVHSSQPIEAFRLVHVSRGDQDAHPAPAGADVVNELPELSARQRINTGRRLVENEQVRIVDQRAAKPELLLHAAGKLAGGTIHEWRQAGAFEQFRYARCPFGLGLAKEPPEKIHILED